VDGLESRKPLIDGEEIDPQVRADAAKVVRFACMSCGMCDGIAPEPRKPRGAMRWPKLPVIVRPKVLAHAAAAMIALPAASQASAAEPSSAAETRGCHAETMQALEEVAISSKPRDMLLRNGLADRCANCAKCPDMVS
jgi:hypothetical protein